MNQSVVGVVGQSIVTETPEILFTEALIRAQLSMGHALKGSDNPFFKNKYADLASVIDAVKSPLGDNGFCYVQYPEQLGDQLVLRTDLMHRGGHKVSSFTPLMVSKNDMQGLGSAITYARRYALSAMVGLTQDDDDGNAASRRDKDNYGPNNKITSENIKPIDYGEIKKREESISELKEKVAENVKIKALRQELGITAEDIQKFMIDMKIDPKGITLNQLKQMVKFLEEEKLARAEIKPVDPSFN